MKRVGRYELERLIGSGGMAEVWLAQQRGVFAGASKRVAVKLMAEHLAADAEFQRMFESEVRLSMLLSHSNIVQVFDAGRDDGHTYLVMEWVEGVDLSRLEDYARRCSMPLPVDVAVHIVAEILRGLGYAHRIEHEGQPAGIVHRDVSPHNVLVSVSGEVKLTDFGVARLAIDKTTTQDIRGKLRYMAPEQARGQSRSPIVDLYPVGAILHELLTGTRFRGEHDPTALRLAVLGGEIPPLAREVPGDVEALRQRLLAPDPMQRFQSAEEALAALERWSGSRQRTEAVASWCRRAMEGASLGAGALDRTDRGDERWAAIDGTATQTATATDVTRTPTRTTAPTAAAAPPTEVEAKAQMGTAIAILVGSLLAVGGLVAIVAFMLRDVEGDASRNESIVYQTRSKAQPPASGAARPLPTLGPPKTDTAPRAGKPIQRQVEREPVAADEDPDEDGGDDGFLHEPSAAELQAALDQRAPQVRACGRPSVDTLVIDVTFVGESGFAARARVRDPTSATPEQIDCIEDALIGTTVPPFHAEVFRFAYTLRY